MKHTHRPMFKLDHTNHPVKTLVDGCGLSGYKPINHPLYSLHRRSEVYLQFHMISDYHVIKIITFNTSFINETLATRIQITCLGYVHLCLIGYK